MPQIIPIKDLRDTTKISDMCHASDDPIFVTRNGYGDMVILSMECFDKLLARTKIHDQVMEGAKQADNGELLDGWLVAAEINEKYGE